MSRKMNKENKKKKSVSPNDNDLNDFIKNNFYIRECYKYRGEKMNECHCNRVREDHSEVPSEKTKWTYQTNTRLRKCDTFGKIKFEGYSESYNEALRSSSKQFIRFNCLDEKDCQSVNEDTIQQAYLLLTNFWKLPIPKFLISINGGYKKMHLLTNQQKKHFKQGLIDVMYKGKTWVVAGGFNVGIHKLVSEAVQEFRCYYDNLPNQVQLIGISTWGVVKNNKKLTPRTSDTEDKTVSRKQYTYSFSQNEHKTVVLDANYDCFLFCDDGTEKQYDKETAFRVKFQKYVEEQGKAFLVQILFEGGVRAIATVLTAAEESVAIVVIKGSGRAANCIAKIMDLNTSTCEKEIKSIVAEYKNDMNIKDEQEEEIVKNLFDMHHNYKEKIMIYDMTDPSMKLEKKLLQAILVANPERELENQLELTIEFNCPEVADTIFSNQEFYKIERPEIRRQFINVLMNNQPEFVRLFIENDIPLDEIINDSCFLESLYKESFKTSCPTGELLQDLRKKSSNKDINMEIAGGIIKKVSGNMLQNPYKKRGKGKYHRRNSDVSITSDKKMEKCQEQISETGEKYTTQDLFLWSLISGHTELAEILWKNGRDHVSSALIAATILQNIATLLHKRGDSDMKTRLTEASNRFQQLAVSTITEAYRTSPEKTKDVLVRSFIGRWNKMTCLQIAISGGMLDFLNHSACKQFIMQVWMTENISSYTSFWRILFSIPCFVLIPSIITQTPSRKVVQEASQVSMAERFPSEKMPLKDCSADLRFKDSDNQISFMESIHIFYTAPFVKFILYFFTYVLFLLGFSYLNLCELKPLSDVTSVYEMWAEFLVYLYVAAFIGEELRQIIEESRTRFIYQLKAYLSGSWNLFDFFIILMFVASVILRFTISNENFIICRCVFSLTLSAFFLRTMQFFFVSKDLGPKIIMIRKMMKDILFFLCIFGVFILAYGTMAQALPRANQNLTLTLVKDIFYLPYFQTYGELMLDDLKETVGNESVVMASIIFISFAIFMLFTNVLLINLLIAMFGFTFNKIQEDSEKFWSYIQIQLVQEFYNKPILPPPLSLLNYIYSVFCWFCRKVSNKSQKIEKKNLLIKVLEKEDNARITAFEQMCSDATFVDLINKHDTTNKSIISLPDLSKACEKMNTIINNMMGTKHQEHIQQQNQNFVSQKARSSRTLERLDEDSKFPKRTKSSRL